MAFLWSTYFFLWSEMFVLQVFAGLVATITSLPKRVYVEFESDVTFKIPDGWSLQNSTETLGSEVVEVVFALKELFNEDELTSTLEAVSDPRSPAYGQRMSLKQVNARFGYMSPAAVHAFVLAKYCRS